jgi:hypothetical protein
VRGAPRRRQKRSSVRWRRPDEQVAWQLARVESERELWQVRCGSGAAEGERRGSRAPSPWARRNTLEAGGRGIQFKDSVADVVPHTLVLNLPCDGGGCESKSTDTPRWGVTVSECDGECARRRGPCSMRFAVLRTLVSNTSRNDFTHLEVLIKLRVVGSVQLRQQSHEKQSPNPMNSRAQTTTRCISDDGPFIRRETRPRRDCQTVTFPSLQARGRCASRP